MLDNTKIVILILVVVLKESRGINEFKTDEPGYSASAEEMLKLVQVEIKLVNFFEKFQEERNVKVESIVRYMTNFQDTLPDRSLENLRRAEFANEVIKNPLFTYLCLRRFVYLFPRIEAEVVKNNITDLMSLFQQLKPLRMPTQKNVEESIKSLIRLKYTYNISVHSFAAGNLNGIETGIILEAEHCYEIAYFASQSNFWTIAIDFYEKARELAVEDNRASVQDISRIEEILEATIQIHDKLLEIGDDMDEFLPSVFQTPLYSRKSSEFQNRVEAVVPHQIVNSGSFNPEQSYEALCRSEELRDPNETKELKCYTYTKPGNKYWLIRPVQIEYLSINPPILQIYNFLSPNETQNVIEASKSELIRSRYTNGDADSQRTSSSGFISDYSEESPFFYINQRIEMLTGLKVTIFSSSEDLQVTHYPPGGHYSQHYDVHSSPTETLDVIAFGDRIATFMIYLSNVDAGGNTAFPKVGAFAVPVRGSAIFWYNLLADGSKDPRSLHGGCSMLYGQKWVANKWISAHDQMFRRKCLPGNKEYTRPFNFS